MSATIVSAKVDVDTDVNIEYSASMPFPSPRDVHRWRDTFVPRHRHLVEQPLGTTAMEDP
jgi:hypothetical protein